MERLDGWALEGPFLVRERSFRDFGAALGFLQEVEKVSMGRAPDVLLQGGKVRMSVGDREGLLEEHVEQCRRIDEIAGYGDRLTTTVEGLMKAVGVDVEEGEKSVEDVMKEGLKDAH
jgi:pterin-4a-carbinolamine dehydratase